MRRGGGSWGEEVVEEGVRRHVFRADLRQVLDGRLLRQAVEQLLDLRRKRDLRLRDVALASQRWGLGLAACPPSVESAVVVGVGHGRRADGGALDLERLEGAQVLAVVDQAGRAFGLALHPGLDARLVRAYAGRAQPDQGFGWVVLVGE